MDYPMEATALSIRTLPINSFLVHDTLKCSIRHYLSQMALHYTQVDVIKSAIWELCLF